MDESQILVRDVIHLATFVAILNGESIWKSHRSDRVRIHEMAREYEVDGIPTDPIQNCEVCMKTSTASPTSRTPEAVDMKQVRSDESKGERRERREHRLGGGTRSQSGLSSGCVTVIVSAGLCPTPKSECVGRCIHRFRSSRH